MKFFRWCIHLLVLLIPVALVLPYGISMGGITVSLPDILILLLLGVIFFFLYGQDRLYSFFIIRREIIPIFAFVFVVFLSLLASGKISHGIIIVLRMFEAVLLVYVFLKSVKLVKIPPEKIFLVLKYAGIVGAVYSILQFFYNIGGVTDSISGYKKISRSAGLAHGGAFGAILGTGVILSLLSFVHGHKWYLKSYNLCLTLVALLGLLLTLNRTWMFSTVIGLLVYFSFKNLKKTILTTTVIAFIFGTLIWFGVPQRLIISFYGKNATHVMLRYTKITSVVSGDISDTSVGSRFKKWGLAFSEFIDNPIWGVGESNLYLDFNAREETGKKRSDNQWLDILSQNGIIAFCLFVFMVFWLLKKSYMRSRFLRDYNSIIFFSIFASWVSGSFFWAIMSGYILLYFAYIAAVGIYIAGLNPISFSRRRYVF